MVADQNSVFLFLLRPQNKKILLHVVLWRSHPGPSCHPVCTWSTKASLNVCRFCSFLHLIHISEQPSTNLKVWEKKTSSHSLLLIPRRQCHNTVDLILSAASHQQPGCRWRGSCPLCLVRAREAWIKRGIDWKPRTGDVVENVHDKAKEHETRLNKSIQTTGMHLQWDLKVSEVNQVRGSGVVPLRSDTLFLILTPAEVWCAWFCSGH